MQRFCTNREFYFQECMESPLGEAVIVSDYGNKQEAMFVDIESNPGVFEDGEDFFVEPVYSKIMTPPFDIAEFRREWKRGNKIYTGRDVIIVSENLRWLKRGDVRGATIAAVVGGYAQLYLTCMIGEEFSRTEVATESELDRKFRDLIKNVQL